MITQQQSPMNRRDVLRVLGLLGSGAVLGTLAGTPFISVHRSAGAAQASPDATATRAAELDELSDLRTRVAQPVVCTPVATAPPPTPTATATVVPPVSSGEPIPHGDDWLVTVLGIAPVPTGGEVPSQGQFLRVNLIIANRTNESAFPPFAEWLLTDANGQSYAVSNQASTSIAGVGWGLTVGPGASEDRSLVFDVSNDIGATFILESREEPTFRVAVSIEARG